MPKSLDFKLESVAEKPPRFILPEELPLSPHLETVILGASEYLSRVGRCKLSRIIHAAISAEQEAQKFEKFTPSTTFAQLAGVSIRTIQRWIGGDVQSCNVNAEAILRLGLRFDKDRTLSLLVEEQARHAQLNKELVSSLKEIE